MTARVLLAQRATATLPPTPPEQLDEAFERIKKENGGELAFNAAIGAVPDQAATGQRRYRDQPPGR